MSHKEKQETEKPTAADAAPKGGPMGPRLFSKKLPIGIRPFWRDSGERIALRWPTDAEWIEADNMIKVLTNPAGRGATETRAQGDVDAAEWLAKKINQNGANISTDDALEIYDILATREAAPAERDGRSVTVRLLIVGGSETVHRLRIPSKTESREFNRAAFRFKDMRRNIRETVFNMAAAGEFYDKLLLEAVGYESRADIPIIHKVPVVTELQVSVDELTRAADDAVFFG